MSGPFIMVTISMFMSVAVLGVWELKSVGPIAFLPLSVVTAWATITLLEWHRLFGVTP